MAKCAGTDTMAEWRLRDDFYRDPQARVAYADPPYLGCAKRHYSKEELCSEVYHPSLIAHLQEFDGWALSCSTPSLPTIILMLHEQGITDYRIASWVKPFCSWKPGVNPAYAWEPVLFKQARKFDRSHNTTRDWISANITLKKGLAGAKPEQFCDWLFNLLCMNPSDEFVDVFPGTGIVSQRWERFRRNPFRCLKEQGERRRDGVSYLGDLDHMIR